jgi:purine-binding chemotaxis protein CheW
LPTPTDRPVQLLLFRVHQWLSAIPVSSVVETLRPLPLEPLANQPAAMLGLSTIRGGPVPVIDAAQLLLAGGRSTQPGEAKRLVLLRVGDRRVALAVDEVLGVRDLGAARWEALPALLHDAANASVLEVGRLDDELLLVLKAARLVEDDVWRLAEPSAERA